MRTPNITPATATRAEIRPGVWLDARRALWLAAERLLVVADLHWGYAASHHARGNLLPAWGDDELEQRLLALVANYRPVEMLWLGDIVHAAEGGARAEAFLRQPPVPTIVLAGNHDRRWPFAHDRSLNRGSYFFHHGDASPPVPAATTEIVGHYHPALFWGDGAGARVKVPALVASARRLILPAFSPWAAGSPWPAADDGSEVLWAITSTRIFPVPHRRPGSPE
jgi:metallophosphoesterase superfamily enzyme